jgi:hypothetical protein
VIVGFAFGLEEKRPIVLFRTQKVSDGSQPPMTFDLFLELNGWLPFAAPSC